MSFRVLGEGPLSLIDIESGKVKSLSADATSISVDRESNRLIYQDGNLMEYSFETGQKKLLDTVYYSDATTLVDDGRFCLTEEVDGVVSCTDISHKDQALAKRMHNTIPAASGRIQQIVLKDNGDIVTLSRKGEVRILTKKKAGD
ncbi:MAG: hypothetical protein NTW50_05290 [Candidatus Berkelbacteria bacterium]|nr:hypothetical protein [Candidatus Berkelbacteria bacterium]